MIMYAIAFTFVKLFGIPIGIIVELNDCMLVAMIYSSVQASTTSDVLHMRALLNKVQMHRRI